MRIRKGDQVLVRTGKYRGQRSEVVQALPKEGKIVVRGVHMVKRHTKPTGRIMQGGIIDKYLPIPVASVSLICKSCGEPTRVGYAIDQAGEKLRVCRKCGTEQ